MSRYFKAHKVHRMARAMAHVPGIKPIRQMGVWLMWPKNREWMGGFLSVLGGGLLVFLLMFVICLAFGGIR